MIHDMQMLLHIEKKALSETIRAYEVQAQSGKQVFINFDRLDAYDAESKKNMMGHCTLELSTDGNELFGRAWNEEMESENGGAEN